MKVKFLNILKKTFLLNIRSIFLGRSNKNDEVTHLINSVGYRGNAYEVKTEDGYILTLHRVRSKRGENFKGTVFLMHGLFRNSADFLATGSNIALPYLLADNGYDIFIGNARGSKFCTEHERLSNKSNEFWNFSWHEIGYYDLPAMLEFSAKVSQVKNVFYTGHPQGCASILVLLSTRPSYNDLISQLHLMAPPIFIKDSTSPAFKIGSQKIVSTLTNQMEKLNITPFLKFANSIASFRKEENPEILLNFYREITCRVVGRNKGEIQISPEAIKSFNYFMSPTVSIKQLIHFIQLHKSGKFQKFDYKENNSYHYGSSLPPEYDLSNVIAPSFLYHAEEDMLVVKKGVDELFKNLSNVKSLDVVIDFNHLDLMLSKNARKLLYNKILELKSTIIVDDEVVKYIKSQEYNGDVHEVITEDGYILRVHHLYPKFLSSVPKKPVLLLHSAFTSSFYFLNSGRNISLGFYLSDNGYDVWLGNVRGSKYSTAHKWLSIESLEYWKFSYHEMGVYDLPPMIDYILRLTDTSACYYIGHSQSCPQVLALLSLRPEYNQKIIQSHLFGGIGAMANPRPPLRTLTPIYFAFLHIFKYLPYVDFKALNMFGENVSNFLCTQGIRLVICQLFNFMVLGGDPQNPLQPNTDPEVYRKFFPTLSPKTGVQQMTHLAQSVLSRKFQLYDYGSKENLEKYGTTKPPLYPLNKITSQIYLYAGKYDQIFRKKDTDLLASQLTNVQYKVISNYNHIDHIYARDVRERLYKYVLREFEIEEARRRP